MKSLALRLGVALVACGLLIAAVLALQSGIRTYRAQRVLEARAETGDRLARESARVSANLPPTLAPMSADGIERARAAMPAMPKEIRVPQNAEMRLTQAPSSAASMLRRDPIVPSVAD